MNFDVVISVGHRFYPFLEFIEALFQKQITISSCFWCLQLSTTIFHRDLAGIQDQEIQRQRLFSFKANAK